MTLLISSCTPIFLILVQPYFSKQLCPQQYLRLSKTWSINFSVAKILTIFTIFLSVVFSSFSSVAIISQQSVALSFSNRCNCIHALDLLFLYSSHPLILYPFNYWCQLYQLEMKTSLLFQDCFHKTKLKEKGVLTYFVNIQTRSRHGCAVK